MDYKDIANWFRSLHRYRRAQILLYIGNNFRRRAGKTLPSSSRASIVNSLHQQELSRDQGKDLLRSRVSGFVLHRALVEAEIDNLIVNPGSVEASTKKNKTDKRDALKLATQLSVGRLQGIRIPSVDTECARLLSRTREQLVRERTRIRNQIRMKLHQFGYIDYHDKRALSLKMVKEILAEHSISEELRSSITAFLSVWQKIEQEIYSLKKQLNSQAKCDCLEEAWRQVPGIGPMSSRVLSNELGDLSQFSNERSLFSYTGLTPSEYSSGERIYRGNISRQGNSKVRCVLVEAAWRAVRKDTELEEVFNQIAARRGKNKAIVAIARKLVGRARAMFRENNIRVAA